MSLVRLPVRVAIQSMFTTGPKPGAARLTATDVSFPGMHRSRSYTTPARVQEKITRKRYSSEELRLMPKQEREALYRELHQCSLDSFVDPKTSDKPGFDEKQFYNRFYERNTTSEADVFRAAGRVRAADEIIGYNLFWSNPVEHSGKKYQVSGSQIAFTSSHRGTMGFKTTLSTVKYWWEQYLQQCYDNLFTSFRNLWSLLSGNPENVKQSYELLYIPFYLNWKTFYLSKILYGTQPHAGLNMKIPVEELIELANIVTAAGIKMRPDIHLMAFETGNTVQEDARSKPRGTEQKEHAEFFNQATANNQPGIVLGGSFKLTGVNLSISVLNASLKYLSHITGYKLGPIVQASPTGKPLICLSTGDITGGTQEEIATARKQLEEAYGAPISGTKIVQEKRVMCSP